jgi:1-deoxy-D-xylulose-5-phosphate synthase
MEYLDKIEKPEDLKNLKINELKTICSEIREHIVSCCALNPGHIGASLGAVEIAVALHYVYNTPKDKLVWDVGHQAYAHKILTGRRDCFINNRKYKGISGFPKMSESEYDSFGVGHSSTSISAALGMAVSAELNKTGERVVAVIGDGALTGGLAFEGLNNAGALRSDILVIVNDNQISIDPNVGALHNYLLRISTSHFYNKLKNTIWGIIGGNWLRIIIQKFVFSTKMAFFKSGSLFESLGFRYFGTIDGNDIEQLVVTLRNIKNIKGPKILHLRTVKGKGYAPAEENQVIWHAPGTFDKETGKRTCGNNGDIPRYQDVFGLTLTELAKNNPKIIGITPAMPSGSSLNIMMDEIPERSFDVGIAEQHAVTFSAGLAASGMLPYCNIYSSFMQRAYDGVIHDVAVQNLKVVFCLDRGGLVGEDGATHHGVYDLAYFRCIPNLMIASPLNETELRNLLYSAQFQEYSAISIRYPRGYGEGTGHNAPFVKIPPGKASLLSDGSGIALLSIGPVGNIAAKAVARANNDGIHVLHYNMIFLKPIDNDALDNAFKNCHTVITVEDGTVKGGLGTAVAEYTALNGKSIKLISMGVPDRFIEQGTITELRAECGFDEEDIYNAIKNVSQTP